MKESNQEQNGGSRDGRFGMTTLTFLVVGNMIGAGVYTTSGYTMATLGAPVAVVLAWIAGGLIALAGAYSYGQLARAIPGSGGEYLFLSRAAHPVLGFIAGWVSLLAGFTGAIAFAATAFESYLFPAGTRPGWLPRDAVAIALMLLAGAAHGLRPGSGALLQNVTVFLKLGLLVFLIIVGLGAVQGSNADAEWGAFIESEGWLAYALAFGGSLVWISLSFSGFNAAVYVAGEARQARRLIPAALFSGTLVVTIFYVALNAVFVYGSDPELIAGRADVAAVAAQEIGGAALAGFVRGVIALSLFTSVSSMIMAAPRVYAKMADDGFLPDWVRFKGHSPFRAVMAQLVLASLIVWMSSLRELLAYLGLTLSLCAALTVGCIFLPSMREHRPGLGGLGVVCLYLLGTVGAAVAMAFREPMQILAAALTFGMGGLAYATIRWGPVGRRS